MARRLQLLGKNESISKHGILIKRINRQNADDFRVLAVSVRQQSQEDPLVKVGAQTSNYKIKKSWG